MILQKPIVFVDVETTGLDPSVHEIIELGAVVAKMKDGVLTVTDQLDVKIIPEHIEQADPQALRVNGYNEADWLFAVELSEAMKSFVQKTQGAVFIAHNATFDWAFIDTALKKTRIEHSLHYHRLDTISIAFGLLSQSESDINRFSLRALCEHFQIDNTRAHSAFSDAYATYELFKKLLKLS